jgi:hypothetical protein
MGMGENIKRITFAALGSVLGADAADTVTRARDVLTIHGKRESGTRTAARIPEELQPPSLTGGALHDEDLTRELAHRDKLEADALKARALAKVVEQYNAKVTAYQILQEKTLEAARADHKTWEALSADLNPNLLPSTSREFDEQVDLKLKVEEHVRRIQQIKAGIKRFENRRPEEAEIGEIERLMASMAVLQSVQGTNELGRAFVLEAIFEDSNVPHDVPPVPSEEDEDGLDPGVRRS